MVASAVSVLACSEAEKPTESPREPGSYSGNFFIIPELLTDSGQPLWLAVERSNPELLTFATERFDTDLEEFWVITPLGDEFYQISNYGVRPADEAYALGVVDDGVYDQVAMSRIGDFVGDSGGDKWHLTHLENGYCRLTTELLGLEMALTVVNDTPSFRLAMAPVSNDPGQHWRLEFSATHGILNDPLLMMCDDG